jgi:zinc transport system substrate-binding protein
VFRFLIPLLLAVLPLCAKPVVAVSILPQQYLIEKIAGDTLEVLVMVSQGVNHETYEPKPNQMKLLAKSDIYISVGLPFERTWLKRFASAVPAMRVVDTSLGIEKIEMVEHHDEHEHHKHDEFDPHIWLDPILVKIQAKTVLDTLSDKYPNNASLYVRNYENFIKELDELHGLLSKKLANLQSKSFFVFHPSLGYFAKRYGLEQIFVEIDGKEPKAAELIAMINKAKAKNIKTLFVEPQVSAKNAKIIAEQIGAKILEIDPLTKDLAKNLNNLADMLSEFN